MTEKDLESLWETLSSATNINKLEYGEAVTIGSVFGNMKSEILKLQEELNVERKNFDFLEKAVDQSYESKKIFSRFHKLREVKDG